jgi:antitoxin (DNA-binding transcriptional repressor) of toxin-antitoxin stability system
MDFVTVREFRTEPAKVWAKLQTEQELVITKNGKPFALLTATAPQRLEEDLKQIRRARATAAVERMRAQARAAGLDSMTLDEINAEIAAARADLAAKDANAAGH